MPPDCVFWPRLVRRFGAVDETGTLVSRRASGELAGRKPLPIFARQHGIKKAKDNDAIAAKVKQEFAAKE
jgi:hypothetical protein